jgi:hypothetical protein
LLKLWVPYVIEDLALEELRCLASEVWVELECVFDDFENFLGSGWEFLLEVDLLDVAIEALDVFVSGIISDEAGIVFVQVTQYVEDNLELIILADNVLL